MGKRKILRLTFRSDLSSLLMMPLLSPITHTWAFPASFFMGLP